MRWPLTGLAIPYAAVLPLAWSGAFIFALAFAYGPQQWPLVDLYGFLANAQALDWSQTLADALP